MSLQTNVFVDDGGNKVYAAPVAILGGVTAPSDRPLGVINTTEVFAGAAALATMRTIACPVPVVRLGIGAWQNSGSIPISVGVYYTINAANDADALLALSRPGCYYVRMDRFRLINFDDLDPVTRIDLIPESALRAVNETAGLRVDIEMGVVL